MTNGAGGHGRKKSKAQSGKKTTGKTAGQSTKRKALVPASLRKGATA